MVKRNDTVKYRVAPIHDHASSFPIDMLRYDRASPATEIDSNKITDTFWYMKATGGDSGRPAATPIELIATANGCPNAERWTSFGWHVTHIWNGVEWEQYHSAYHHHRVTK